MPERDVNQLAADVREALAIGWPEGDHAEPHVFTESVVALDELVGLVGTLQQERDGWETVARHAHRALDEFDVPPMAPEYDTLGSRIRRAMAKERNSAVAAEAALADLRRQMEELREQGLWPVSKLVDQLATTRQALTEVLNCKGPYEGTVSDSGGEPAVCRKCADIARRALADTGGDTK